MKKVSLALLLAFGSILLGCPDKQDTKPDPAASTAKPTTTAAASASAAAAPKAGGGW